MDLKITFCPRCHSTEHHFQINDGMMTGQNKEYVCNDCNFQSILFPREYPNKISKWPKVPILENRNKSRGKNNKIISINYSRVLIAFLLILLIYTANRFGLFDFITSPHDHPILNYFSRYEYIK